MFWWCFVAPAAVLVVMCCSGGGFSAFIKSDSGGRCWWDWRWQSCRLGSGACYHSGDGEVMRWSRCVRGERWGCGGEVLLAFGSDVLRFDAVSVCEVSDLLFKVCWR
ncbi:hypothetical protein QL285_002984 [Trifolium repens]|nr:hypothetical protein QL285_002984 [Trifolium repens]